MPSIRAKSTGRPHARAYQPLFARAPPTSKTRMKESRYSTSGTIHTKGTEATFCVIWLVTASSISEPRADSVSQSRYSEALGGESAVFSFDVSAVTATATVGCAAAIHAEVAHSTANRT